MDLTWDVKNVEAYSEKFVHVEDDGQEFWNMTFGRCCTASDAEVDRLFDPSSLSHGEEPKIVLIAGGPAAGKTTLRRARYSTGYVLIDAADIFLSLQGDELIDFPGPLEQAMERVGSAAAVRAIAERRHIVSELIGEDREATVALCRAMERAGYSIGMVGVTCDIDVALERNQNRSENNISAYYAEPYHRRWLIQAASAARRSEHARFESTSGDDPPRNRSA